MPLPEPPPAHRGLDLRYAFYVSRARLPLPPGEIERLVWTSDRANWRAGITGAMVFTGRHFAQWLEGPAPAVDALLARIARDRRHEAMTVVVSGPAVRRRYARWSLFSALAPGLDATLAAGLAGAGGIPPGDLLDAFIRADALQLDPRVDLRRA